MADEQVTEDTSQQTVSSDRNSLPYSSVNNLSTKAQAILEVAPTIDDGLHELATTLDSARWDKPEVAREVTQKYGDALRYRFQDKDLISAQELAAVVPVDFNSITGEGETDKEKKIDQINQWEEINNKTLSQTPNAGYVVNQTKLTDSVSATASQMRHEINTKGQSNFGDLGYRFLEGTAPVARVMESINSTVADTLGLPESVNNRYKASDYIQWLKEHEKEAEGDDWTAYTAAVLKAEAPLAGMVAGTLATGGVSQVPGVLGAATKYGGTALMGSLGIGATLDRYDSSLKESGDKSQAFKSATMEAASQAVQLSIFGRVVGKGVSPASGIVGGIAKSGAELGVGSGIGQVLSTAAANIGAGQPATKDLFNGVPEAVAVGGLGGGLLGGVRAGLSGSNNISGDIEQAFSPGGLAEGSDALAGNYVNPNGPYVKKVTGTVRAAPRDTSPESNLSPVIETQDGSRYVSTGEGSTQRVDANGTVYHPLDHTFYVDTETATNLAAANILSDSEAPGKTGSWHLTTDGENLYGVTVDNEGNITARTKNIPAQKDYSEGSHPVEVNTPRSPNEGVTLFRSRIGSPITKAEPVPEKPVEDLSTIQLPEAPSLGSTAGAAYGGGLNQNKTAEKFSTSQMTEPDVQSMFDAVSYAATSLDMAEPRKFVSDRGLTGAIHEYFNNKNIPDAGKTGIGTAIIEQLHTRLSDAKKSGDASTYETLKKVYESVGLDLIDKGHKLGVGLVQYRNLAEILNPLKQVQYEKTKLETAAHEEVAKQENIPVEEVKTVDQKLDDITKQLTEEKKAVEATLEKPKEGATQPEITSPKIEALKTEQEKLTKIKEKKDKAVERKQEAFTDKDQEDLHSLLTQLKTVKDEGTKSKIYDAINAIKERTNKKASEQDPIVKAQNTRLKAATKVAGDNLKLVLNNLHSYFISNVLGTAAVGKKAFSDISALISTPVSYLISGQTAKAREFSAGALHSLFNTGSSESALHAEAFTGLIHTLLTGESSKSREPDFLKRAPAVLKPIGAASRALSAITEMFYRANRGGFDRSLAYEHFKKEGKGENVPDLKTYIADKLYNASTRYSEAMKEVELNDQVIKDAGGQGLTPREKRLAASDVMRASLPKEVLEESSHLSQINTFTQKPTGTLGFVYDTLGLVREIPIGPGKTPNSVFNIRPAAQSLSFLRVGLNIANMLFDYTPAGFLKAGRGWERAGFTKDALGEFEQNKKINTRDKSVDQRQLEFGRATIGTMMGFTLFEAAHQGIIHIHGKGSDNWQAAKQEREEGREPYTVGFGDFSISYKHTLLELPLAAIGAVMDKIKYGKDEDPQTISDMTFTAGAVLVDAVVDQSMFKSISDMWSAAKNSTSDSPYAKKKMIEALGLNPLKSLVPGYGLANRFTTDPIDTRTGMWAKMISGIPFVQQLGGTKPALNYFGEPIRRTGVGSVSHVFGFDITDHSAISPESRWLADNKYDLPRDQNISIHIDSNNLEKFKSKHSRVAEERERNYGADNVGILTSAERYQLIETAGPKIKQVVNTYMNRYGSSGRQEKVQQKLKEDISKVFNDTKKELFIR